MFNEIKVQSLENGYTYSEVITSLYSN